ncbi:MAG: hypothetical protein VW644_02490 [Alphaproteobacteria bacterium]
MNGALGNPKVSVNPLTVLTPGIIRRLLTGFGSSDDNAVNGPVQTSPTDPTVPGTNRPEQ